MKCNVKKGGRTPEQAHMHLITKPVKPKRSPVINIRLADERYCELEAVPGQRVLDGGAEVERIPRRCHSSDPFGDPQQPPELRADALVDVTDRLEGSSGTA